MPSIRYLGNVNKHRPVRVDIYARAHAGNEMRFSNSPAYSIASHMKQHILSLGKDSIIYGVGSVITRFTGLITLPLFTAYLTPEEYGVITMLALLTMVAQPVFSLGLSAAMGPSYFEGDCLKNKSKAVWTAFAINILSSVVLLTIAWFFPVTVGELVRLPSDYSVLVCLSLTGCAMTIVATSFIQRVQFERQATIYVAATLASTLCAILVCIFTVVFLGWGVKGMVVGQLAGNAVTLITFFLIGIKATKPSISLNIGKELLRQGSLLIPGFAFLFILMHGNKYILEQQAGLDAVGIYSIGFNLGMAISIVTSGIASAWYPFFMTYQMRQSEARQIFGRIFTYYTFGVGLLTLFFFIFSRPLVMVLASDNFLQASSVIGLVASANYFMGMYSLFLPGMYYRNEIGAQSLIQGGAVIFSLPITYYLVKYFGVLGAGFSVAFGHLLVACFTYAWNFYRREIYIQIDYEWRRLSIFLLIFFIVAFVYLNFYFESLLDSFVFSCSGAIFLIFITIQLLKHSEAVSLPYFKHLKL